MVISAARKPAFAHTSTRPRVFEALLACLLCLATALLVIADAQAQGCSTRVTASRLVSVFDKPPEVTTGRGFVYGTQVNSLQPGQSVYICKEVDVGFGFVSERWVQVAFRRPDKTWQYGWVRDDGLTRTGASDLPKKETLHIVTQAQAATVMPPQRSPSLEVPDDELPPPPPPAKSDDFSLTPRSILFQAQFVLLLSIAVLLGILGQGVYELFSTDERVSWTGVRKRFIRPLVVSPIVMLIFLGTVDLAISQWKQGLILWLLAFQAGFCWQKALAKSSD